MATYGYQVMEGSWEYYWDYEQRGVTFTTFLNQRTRVYTFVATLNESS